MRPILLALLLAVAACAKKPPNASGQVRSSGREPTEIYDHALTMMKRGLFDNAMKDFQELRTFHRDDPLSVKAQLGLADLHYQKGEYEEARYAYEEFSTYHPRHPDLDYVTWRTGQCIWKRSPKTPGRDQATTRAAVNTWTGFESRFPDSEHVEEVKKLRQRGLDRLAAKELFVARFYARRDGWAAVEGRTRTLLWRYPESTHAAEALGLLALAYQEIGRPDEARTARDRLAANHPDAPILAQVDRRLTKPPGTPPEDVTFVRPYRIPGFDGTQAMP